MPPSFFDYHLTHGQNGKIKRLVNASFSALSSRFKDQKASKAGPVFST